MHTLNRRALLSTTAAMAGASAIAAAQTETPSARLNTWLEERFKAWLERSPMMKAYLGLKEDMDKWDDQSEDRARADYELAQKDLADLNAQFDPAQLDDAARLSHRLYRYESEKRIKAYAWRHHDYPVNQMFGWQQGIPDFLMNIHRVGDRAGAEAYIARLEGVPALMDQIVEGIRIREAKGVMPPRFVFKYVIDQSRNVLAGRPFGGTDDCALFADIKGKVDKLDLEAGAKQKLTADAEKALTAKVKPAYDKLLALMEAQQARAGTDDGVWKLPDGESFYTHMLAHHTTTGMDAAEIHRFGLDEVARIHGEMRAIMTQVKFDGDLQSFFKFMQNDPRFYYSADQAGRAAYIADAQKVIRDMMARLDDMFITKPKARLEVREVEAYRQKGSPAAFYQGPGAFDGRPGTYYANTYDMKTMPKYELEALAYHEAVPGHHMQIAIAQELKDVPSFRKFSTDYTAYVEGWGLYSEMLPKEFGFYRDPYSDFGRLSMELWRAIRLVLDTGLHAGAMKWTREQAMAYAAANSSYSAGNIRTEVERFIVMPGQATAYKIGMAKIIELRERARAALGAAFDIRAYHDLVLGSGALPLTVLDEAVADWTARRKA
ncbi:MAG: DUF885 domain-containing protein [Rhodospirillaceae bacterium]|nr:DUF885 domain-containing protein [Rhodospirillaceae bacterium]